MRIGVPSLMRARQGRRGDSTEWHYFLHVCVFVCMCVRNKGCTPHDFRRYAPIVCTFLNPVIKASCMEKFPGAQF